MIDDNFSQLLTETCLVEVYLGYYFMFSNTVIAVKIFFLKARQRQHGIVGVMFVNVSVNLWNYNTITVNGKSRRIINRSMKCAGKYGGFFFFVSPHYFYFIHEDNFIIFTRNS